MRSRRALGYMLWTLLLVSASARMEQRPELELARELRLRGIMLSELGHNRTYHGLYRWNCSHAAFFPHACKDGEPLWRPPQAPPERTRTSSQSARRLHQFIWDEADPYLTGGQLVSLHRPAPEALAAKRAPFERSGDAACAEATARAVACTALLACLFTCLLTLILVRSDLLGGLGRRFRALSDAPHAKP
ncbi:MAG: hypothetical protein EBR09_07475 [Proteobacteria bacterium]|jgi:hypothetical protein|nr:hypothetical protein [Pseudomonadota bacterium]